MTRLKPYDVDELSDELRAYHDQAEPHERMMLTPTAHQPVLLTALHDYHKTMTEQGTLPGRLVELVRLRIAFHNQCRSCMAMRYQSGLDDGLTEGLVCSLEQPAESDDLTDTEKAALAYADVFATNHFAITDQTLEDLRPYFSEPEIVELGLWVAYFTGFGRLMATYDFTEDLPEGWDAQDALATPSTGGTFVWRPDMAEFDVEQLRMSVVGPVLTAQDEGRQTPSPAWHDVHPPTYDEARHAWNGSFDRHPDVIVLCSGVADIQAALAFARANDLTIAIRGGGHSASGSSMMDGGMIIDLRLLRGVHVDVQSRTAVVAAGTLLWEVDRETQAHGLAVTAGTVSHTGVGGLTLYGGIGRMMRKYGLTIDNVLSFDIVTADGQWRHVDAETEPDLFWALRGGGGDFGVVTHFTFQLHPVGPIIYGGYLGWPIEQAKEVFLAVRDQLVDAPEELTVQFILSTGPDAPFMPPALQGAKCLMMPITWIGEDLDEGERVIAPFRERVAPTLDMIGRFPYTMIQAGSDALAPHGLRNIAVYSGFFPDVSEELFDTALAEAATFPSKKSLVEMSLLGGAVARVPADATAAGVFRGPGFTYTVASNSDGPDNDAACREWVDGADAALAPFRMPGRYLNFVTADHEDGVREALGDQTYARLAEIKAAYDPDRVFARNPNQRVAREPQTA